MLKINLRPISRFTNCNFLFLLIIVSLFKINHSMSLFKILYKSKNKDLDLIEDYNGIKMRSKDFDISALKENFSNQAIEIINSFIDRSIFSDSNAIIFFGPAGSGKKTIIETFASKDEEFEIYKINCFEIIENYIKLEKKNYILDVYKDIISKSSKKNVKVLIIFDNIDPIFNKEFYNEINNFTDNLYTELNIKDSNLFFVFLTSNLNNLPDKLKSYCKIVQLDLPDLNSIKKTLQYYYILNYERITKNKLSNLNEIKFVNDLSSFLVNFSYKDLKDLTNAAFELCLEDKNYDKDNKQFMISNKIYYILAIAKYYSDRVILDFNFRKLLLSFYIVKNNLSNNLIENLLTIVSAETDGLPASEIEKIIENVKNIVALKKLNNDNYLPTLEDFYTGIYYNQKIKLPSLKIKLNLLKYYFKNYNVDLSEAILKDLTKYIEKEDFNAKELMNIAEDFIKLRNENESDNFFIEDLYFSFYKELLKKAKPFEIITKIKMEYLSDFIPLIPVILNSKFIEEKNELKELKDINNFVPIMHYCEKCIVKNRLDYLNKTNPDSKAREYLINYFLSKYKNNLSDFQKDQLIIKTTGLSWYSIGNIILTALDISNKRKNIDYIDFEILKELCQDKYFIELKYDAEPDKDDCIVM